MCDIIRKEGYILIEVCNGKEVIDVFFNLKDIDIIILDVMMFVYDGWEVFKEIREYLDILVIMFIVLGDEKYEVFGLNKGVDDYILKFFSYEVFIVWINNIVRKLKKEYFKDLIMGKIKIN